MHTSPSLSSISSLKFALSAPLPYTYANEYAATSKAFPVLVSTVNWKMVGNVLRKLFLSVYKQRICPVFDIVKKLKKEVEASQEDEEAEVEDKTKPKIVIEHCKQCNAFKTRAIQVKEGLEGAVPGVTVALNPEKGDETSICSNEGS
ncbi:hypothetical protein F2Q70_00013594 [Brassica cretica]|uniref:Uncharacterized protein n=1 Tax=Brassica cretica TaxID=69181 RepID=A0A8S9M0H7_BRACR|nr:hypothetical protein F2Q70_00013594 [Brassica cretica]